MRNLVFLEFRKLKSCAIAMLLLGIIYQLLFILQINNSSMITYNIELWFYANSIMNFFFPLIATVPYLWQAFKEINSGYLKFISVITDIKRYLITKIATVSVISGLVITLINLIGLIFSLYFVFEIKYPSTQDNTNFYLYQFMVKSPFLYGFILSVWRGILGSILCISGLSLIFAIKNLYVVMTGIFIFFTLENFVTSILGMPGFSFTTSINPSRLSSDVITSFGLVIAPILYLTVSLIIILYHMGKKSYV